MLKNEEEGMSRGRLKCAAETLGLLLRFHDPAEYLRTETLFVYFMIADTEDF